MKDMSNEELINKFRAMCNLFIIYGKFQKDPDYNEANKISDKLLSRLSAGEDAIKRVAELKEKLLMEDQKQNESYRVPYLEKEVERLKATALAKHKEAL